MGGRGVTSDSELLNTLLAGIKDFFYCVSFFSAKELSYIPFHFK